MRAQRQVEMHQRDLASRVVNDPEPLPIDDKTFNALLEKPSNLPAERTAATARLQSSRPAMADGLSVAKEDQLKDLYHNDTLSYVMERPVRGQTVEMANETKTSLGKLLRVDPKNPDNFSVLVEEKGVRKIISVKQTDVATSPLEREAMRKQIFEEMEASGENAENFQLTLNATARKQAEAVKVAEAKAPTEKEIADQFVARLTENATRPYVQEAKLLEKQQEGVPRFSQEWFDLQHQIGEKLKPIMPLTHGESEQFAGLNFIPKDADQFSSQERHYLHQLDQIRKSRQDGISVRDKDAEFKHLRETLQRPAANMKTKSVTLDRSWRKMTSDQVSYGTAKFRVPDKISIQLRNYSPLRDGLEKRIETLFGTKPSEIRLSASSASADYQAVKRFFDQAKIKQATETDPSLKYLHDRFQLYQQAMDDERNLGRGVKPSSLEYQRLYGEPMPAIEGVE